MNTSAEARRGLALPRKALRRLAEAGIFVQSSVSMEFQQLAGRCVVRGVESGGATEPLGRYVTYCGEQGQPLGWLHPLDAIGINGVHALVVAPVLVRTEMFRRGHSYDLLITRHAPAPRDNGKRPSLESITLFRALDGYLALDLTRPKKNRDELPIPGFFTRTGEPLSIPSEFEAVIQAVLLGVNCCRCVHSHYLRPARGRKSTAGESRSKRGGGAIGGSMTPAGDIELEVIVSLVIRARAKDLVPLFNILSSGQQFMVIVVEDSRCREDQNEAAVQSK